ncbi:MAG TPA: hypothetical protein PKD86_03870 [Gemmatales bacterium]|nr:hypothetical protein [Gemmatales bacterium]
MIGLVVYNSDCPRRNRVVSTWIGTNDTPASGSWLPSNITSPANMVQVAEYEYDGGGDSGGWHGLAVLRLTM